MNFSKDLIRAKKNLIISQFGEWTAHNIRLMDDIYTIDNHVVGQEHRLRRILQIVSDNCRQPMSKLRILDLACLEGLYAIEFALRGAEVVGIEGREANIKKAEFARDILGVNNLDLVCDDIRNLSVNKFGHFDVVLCCGILYHLDAPDIFHFLESISEVCKGFAIIDTHFIETPEEVRTYKEKQYWGRIHSEFPEQATLEEKQKLLWAALDNPNSFWLTPYSLFNLLQFVGFTSIYQCYMPTWLKGETADRFMLLALKGSKQQIISTPLINNVGLEEYPF